MLMVPAEVYDIIADRMEKAGIYVLLKPVNKTVLLCVLRFAIVTQKRIRAMRMRNRSLKDRLSEIKVIDRAKCLLMEHEQLSEAQAHRYLEKRAMEFADEPTAGGGAAVEKISAALTVRKVMQELPYVFCICREAAVLE